MSECSKLRNTIRLTIRIIKIYIIIRLVDNEIKRVNFKSKKEVEILKKLFEASWEYHECLKNLLK